MKQHRSRTIGWGRGESGFAMVEFAMVFPFFITMIVGIIEFGVGFSENLNVRHTAREAARLVAVNYSPDGDVGTDQTDVIVAEVCQRAGSPDEMTISFALVDPSDDEIGALATATVQQQFDSVTGLMAPILDGTTLRSTVEFRLEQDASWDPASEQPCP